MLVINKLTEPGGIKRVELRRDTVVIKTHDREDIVYVNTQRGTYTESQEVTNGD